MARGGEGVVETSRGVVLVPFALVGEEVEVDSLSRARGTLRGRLHRVLRASSERVEPACPIVERCGGCPWMMWAPEAQRARKRRWVEEAVQSGGGETRVVEIEPAPESLRYRRRARLAFVRTGGGVRVGYRGWRSHRIVDVEDCPILEPVLASGLQVLRTRLAAHLAGEGEALLARGPGGPALSLRSSEPQPPELYAEAERVVSEGLVAGVALRVGGSSAAAWYGDPREHGEEPDGGVLVGPAGGFSQANAAVNARLVRQVLQWAEPAGRQVLELYAGYGNLTVPLAAEAASLTAVEADPESAQACRDNLRTHGLSARVKQGEAESAPTRPKPDVVVLDPPRTGARDTLEPILRMAPERIVYVSCNPATLGRDLGRLQQAGYGADAARAFDMFPHTSHVEAVVRMRRA
jgi:23S rRNA (uracil1939-C5)-methyltransferase